MLVCKPPGGIIRMYGTLGMAREWLMKDNITPVETIVQMMFVSMPESLKPVFFGT